MSYADDLLIGLAIGLLAASIASAYIVWQRGESWDG